MDLNTIVSLVGVVVLLLWKTGIFSKLFTTVTHDPLGGMKAAAKGVEILHELKAGQSIVFPSLPTDFITTVQTYKKVLDTKLAEYQDFISKLKGL